MLSGNTCGGQCKLAARQRQRRRRVCTAAQQRARRRTEPSGLGFLALLAPAYAACAPHQRSAASVEGTPASAAAPRHVAQRRLAALGGAQSACALSGTRASAPARQPPRHQARSLVRTFQPPRAPCRRRRRSLPPQARRSRARTRQRPRRHPPPPLGAPSLRCVGAALARRAGGEGGEGRREGCSRKKWTCAHWTLRRGVNDGGRWTEAGTRTRN
jgi:hypothetical protein